jgi:WxcM-like, C-terminal
MTSSHDRMPLFLTAVTEDRGTLLSIDLATCPFAVRRVFTISAPDTPVQRGGHAADCMEYILLVRGTCAVHLGKHAPASYHLNEPGDGCLVEAGTYVRYELETPDATLLVLADKPYIEEPRD